MKKRPTYRRTNPPRTVVLLGSSTDWSEATWRKHLLVAHEFTGRGDCPNGCRNRDLAVERSKGYRVLCLRCLTSTFDPDNWRFPSPAVAIASRQQERERAKRIKVEASKVASLAFRRFAGRGTAKKAARHL
jgi:hypothetical protein